MKFTLAISLILLAGCSPSVMQIGKINMISNRNVETSFDYALILYRAHWAHAFRLAR